MNSFNSEQEKAVNHPSGPLLIAAGAGSGKTKALTGRLKALIARGIPPHAIVAITFTNKAAREMRERVFGVENADPRWSPSFPTLGEPFIGTFHSLGARFLKHHGSEYGRTSGFSIYDDGDSLSLVKKLAKEMELGDTAKPMALMGRISKLKSELKDATELITSDDLRERKFAALFDRYEEALKEQNAFDFDDLIEKPVRILNNRSELKERYQDLFSHILVDEYQDINTAQYHLVRLLGERHSNVTVVGDDSQAIYGFRGADFRNFLNFHRDWPGATIIKLEQNYRSTGSIIKAASTVISKNKEQTPKQLWTANPDGEPITILAADDQDSEAAWIASEIRQLRSAYRVTRNAGPEPSIAVLYRTNAQSRAIEQSLISENIPYKIYGGLKFYDRKEIKDVLAALRLAANSRDLASAERLQKSLGKRAGSPVIERMSGRGSDLPAAELINLFMESAKYKALLEKDFNNVEERLENIAELTNFAAGFTSLEEFLERAALLSSADAPANEAASRSVNQLTNPVNLMTIHIAKGLEFDTVFIAGVNEGMLPHERSMTSEAEVEEERRLMYVAMTRARAKLFISFYAFASRFIYEIPRELCIFKTASDDNWSLTENEDEMWIEQ